MNHKQTLKLIDQVAQEYLGEHWRKKLSKVQCEIWEEMIGNWDYDLAKLAIREMFIDHPAYRNEFNYRMPDVKLFKEYYDIQAMSNTSYCPCCAGTGWIHYQADAVTRCNHTKPTSDEPCHNFHCQPRKESPCPFGTQYYNAIRIEYMDRLKQDPAYQLGLTFLRKNGKLLKLLTEKLPNIVEEETPDIPSHGEDVPF